MKTCLTALALVACAMLAGCHCNCNDKADSKSAMAAPATVNTMCVMNPHDSVDPEVKPADFHGQKVGFCCNGCAKKWNNLSDADKQARLDKVMAKK